MKTPANKCHPFRSRLVLWVCLLVTAMTAYGAEHSRPEVYSETDLLNIDAILDQALTHTDIPGIVIGMTSGTETLYIRSAGLRRLGACRRTRSGFERPFFRLAASGSFDDKTNIACFAVLARRKNGSLSGRRRNSPTRS